MIIQVDWYKSNGKWYAGGEVRIADDIPSWDSIRVLQSVIANQNIMVKGWDQDCNYIVVIDDQLESHIDRNYKRFFKRLWMPEQINSGDWC